MPEIEAISPDGIFINEGDEQITAITPDGVMLQEEGEPAVNEPRIQFIFATCM